jgi:hypothetical protein
MLKVKRGGRNYGLVLLESEENQVLLPPPIIV